MSYSVQIIHINLDYIFHSTNFEQSASNHGSSFFHTLTIYRRYGKPLALVPSLAPAKISGGISDLNTDLQVN